MKMELCVTDGRGAVLAQACGDGEAMLCLDREYQPGDAIQVYAWEGAHLRFMPDPAVAESEVYLPAGQLHWPVPQGEARLAYSPGSFTGLQHIITVRAMEETEITALRNIALNPADLRGGTDFYPHAFANVETRGESCFAARNVIDGLRFNQGHGQWPFQSWGIGGREDAWCRLDFGREVLVERMALTLRADFPHDAWWTSGHVVTESGEDIAFSLRKTGQRQYIGLGGRRVKWLRLERMVKSDDPSAFPSLTQWEVWGHDI